MRSDGTTTLDHYLKPILEHRNLIIAVTAATAILAVAASLVLPPSYRSTASVLLTPISGNPLTPLESDTDVDMATELLISTSKAVIGLVAEDLAAQSIDLGIDELADNVSAVSPRDSKVLDLTYRATAPDLAQTVANSFATNYLEYREQIAAENRAEAVEVLNERIALLKEQLSQIEGRLSQLESGTQPHVSLSVERDSVDGELQAQQEGLAALSTLSLSAGEVLSPARLPAAPSGPGLAALLAGGVAGGLVIGVMGAMLLSAVQASRAPRNRRASDRIEHNRRLEDRFQVGGRRATDRPTESAVQKLARVTAGREHEDASESVVVTDRADVDDDTMEGTLTEATQTDQPQLDEATQTDQPQLDEATPTDESPIAETPTEETPTEATPADEAPPDTAPDATIASVSDAPEPTTDITDPVVHQGAPPPPPGSSRSEGRQDEVDDPAPGTEPGVAPAPEPPATAVDHEAAAHFGDDVPPPPRNKAKLRRKEDSPPAHLPVDQRSSRVTAPSPATAVTSNLEVEADFTRLVRDISRRVADGPLTCLAVGQDDRAQSVTAGFALVDALKDLNTEILIIDAVLDEPVLADILGLPETPGLSELVVGETPMETTIRRLDGFNGLYALTVGTPTPAVRSAFGTPRLADLLRRAKELFPVTVILGGDVADAAVMSRTESELDGVVAGTFAPPGQAADTALIDALSALDAPTWLRISVPGGPESTSTAAAATTNA